MWRLLSSKLTNVKEIVDYKESILFSKVSHMSKKNHEKKFEGWVHLTPRAPYETDFVFFSPWFFFTICTMDFAEKKGLFIVWQLDHESKLKGLNLKEPLTLKLPEVINMYPLFIITMSYPAN